jgi:hypothetical protein
VACDGYEIAHTSKAKYLGTILDCKLSFSLHLDYVETKIRKNLAIFKRLASSRMLSEEVAYRLYNAYIRPHYQSLLNIYPLLSISKQNKLEALNRQVFRSIHGWYDATNIEVSNLCKYKTIDELTQVHWVKLIGTILRTNPSVIGDFIQHKMYLLYIQEYFKNPNLLKEKQKIFNRGRTNKKNN